MIKGLKKIKPLQLLARVALISFTFSLLLGLSACVKGLPGETSGSEQSQVEKSLKRFRRQFVGPFDTVTDLIAYTPSEEAFNAFADVVQERLQYYSDLFTIYDSEDLTASKLHESAPGRQEESMAKVTASAPSVAAELTHQERSLKVGEKAAYAGRGEKRRGANLREINAEAAAGPVLADPEVFELVRRGKELSLQVESFNVALGPVTFLWHEAMEKAQIQPEKASLPSETELKKAAAHCQPSDIILDGEAGTVFLKDKDMRLDFGGFAKGYAVERIAEELSASGEVHALISVGGNLRSIGSRPDGQAWQVGVLDPRGKNGETLDHYALEQGALVTSGVYERFFTVEGVRYHHIIDPATLYPSKPYVSISVSALDSGLADALSTALFGKSVDEGKKLAESFGVSVLWLMADGSIVKTERWPACDPQKQG